MNKIIIFDFNRTLFNPDTGVLDASAEKVLSTARLKGYTLVLLAQAEPRRRELINQLGIADYFADIVLVAKKRPRMLQDIAAKYSADLGKSFAVGDRARSEVLLGHMSGWQTIWLRAGRFADETPTDYVPKYTITTLEQALLYL